MLKMKNCTAGVGLVLSLLLCSHAWSEADIYYFHNDHLGTPQVLTDKDQNVVWKANYDPFGNAEIVVEQIEMPLRMPGQYFDSETGYLYNYYRDYDPTLGRYIQSDPIGLGGGLNTYGYVGGNPINYFDPFGLFQFGIAPLGGMPGGAMIPMPGKNNDAWHEHGFYDDGSGDNVGFFRDDADGELRRDENRNDYDMLTGFYDDDIMREAEALVRSGIYDLTNNNCQDYADKLRDAYDHIFREKFGMSRTPLLDLLRNP